MKKFIHNILLFAIIFVSVFLVIIIANYMLVKATEIIIPKHKKVLILGDSNSECAINDSIFNSVVNLSSSSDSYYYSYLKLKKIIDENQIDTLLLSFSPHNIFDNGWLFNESHIYSRFKLYYPLMNYYDFKFLTKNKPIAVFKAVFAVPKQTMTNFFNVLQNKPIRYGGFKLLNRNILSEVQNKLIKGEKLPFFRIPEKLTVSEYEVLYLKKIISLCKNKKIKLILINLPKRKELLNYPRYGVKKFNNFYENYLSDTEFFDFSEIKLPDNYYADFVHLNAKGSAFFSKLLKKQGFKNLKKKFIHSISNQKKQYL